ncbi:hypothetical protein FRB91_006555 [Serendipita sp. 411]|nr:hypothetical protein FRB91_006555 [Serendipita sp. 411]
MPPKRNQKSNRIEEDEQASDASAWLSSPSNLDGHATSEHSSVIGTASRFLRSFFRTKSASQEHVFVALDVAMVEGTDLSKPLKATCNALQSVLQMVPKYIKKKERERLAKMLKFHIATVENQQVKLDEDQEIEGSALLFDAAIKESLESYASKLKEIYNFVKSEEIGTGHNSGALGERLQDLDNLFLEYTVRRPHLS